MEMGDGVIIIRWFEGIDLSAEREGYAREFVRAMANKAREQKYVSAKPLVTDNPKYSFRVFLNSLGFKGADSKKLRADLLTDLSGNSAWRHGKPEGSVV